MFSFSSPRYCGIVEEKRRRTPRNGEHGGQIKAHNRRSSSGSSGNKSDKRFNRERILNRSALSSIAPGGDKDRGREIPAPAKGDLLLRNHGGRRRGREGEGGKCQRISYLRRSSLVPEIPPFPPTKLAGDMFIVNESYSGGCSWRTATCPEDAAATRGSGKRR